jgi:L-seryl-tRNA(Ser) seleniumtransferase
MLPTFVLALAPGGADRDAARLRRGDPPVVARVEDGRLVLDPRTVLPGEDALVVSALRALRA